MANTDIIQARATTTDELPAGSESPAAAINLNVLESRQAEAPVNSFTPFHSKIAPLHLYFRTP